MPTHRLEPAVALAGRLLLSLIFLHEAWAKMTNYPMTVAYMQAFGVPAELLPFAVALELGCSLLILAGYQTQVAATLLASFCVTTAIVFHTRLADRNQLLHFEKDLAIAGGFLVLFARGAGGWSLDALLSDRGRDRRTAMITEHRTTVGESLPRS